jgi:hypothetical protein
MGDPSDSITFEYLVKTDIPGPMDACARSTGAMLPHWRSDNATGSSFFREAINSRRVASGASEGLGRQTRTIEEARALVPIATLLTLLSLLIGHVPCIEKPEFSKPFNMVSQPVEDIVVSFSSSLSSACLKA